MRIAGRIVAAAIAATVVGTLGMVSPALAQDTDKAAEARDFSNKRVTLNLENADIRYGLKLLFQSVEANYTIEPGVQGAVTVSLSDVSFRTALESMIRTVQAQAPITYRVENGVYNVGLKRADPAPEPDPEIEVLPPARRETKIAKINLNYADVVDITTALGGTMLQSRFSQFSGGGFGNGFGNGGMGGGMGNGLGGNSVIGVVNFGSGNFGQFGGSGPSGGSGTGFIGQFGNGSGSNGGGQSRGR